MEHSISINYPESLAFSLKMSVNEFQNEMKTVSLVKLYELGKISSGFASKLLEISRVDFLELLGKYNVSYFDNDLELDFGNA
ncbi:MAG: hypothetical protein CSA15_04580 [Candidatus Delongbacteria bacterium]|nr:MAG: hypothetical protein CSA15_04580 [Candidatus Delongbacteria bacterium]